MKIYELYVKVNPHGQLIRKAIVDSKDKIEPEISTVRHSMTLLGIDTSLLYTEVQEQEVS